MLPDARNALADIPDDVAPYAESIFERWGGVLPLLDADPRAGNMVEITTGLIARTSAGWTLLLRDVPNWWDLSGYQVLDGIVETDWFPSMVPTIIRLPERGRVVRFHRDQPLAAIQPIPRVACRSATLSAAVAHQGPREFPTGPEGAG